MPLVLEIGAIRVVRGLRVAVCGVFPTPLEIGRGNSPQRRRAAYPQPNRPRARRRARARSAVASTGPGLSVRFVPPALSAGGLAEMRFVRHLLARRWVGRASRRASFQAV